MARYELNNTKHRFFSWENKTRIAALFSLLISLAAIPLTLVELQHEQSARQFAAEKANEQVITGPAIHITSPTNGSVIPKSYNLPITAEITAAIRITKVEFSVNGDIVCTVSSPPYTCKWSPQRGKSGSYTIIARVYDAINSSAFDSVTISAR